MSTITQFFSVLCLSLMSLSALAVAKVEFLNKGTILPTNMPFSESVRVDNTLYLSGQLGVIPGTLKLKAGGIEAESKQTMVNIQSILKANGLTMNDLFKCTVMLADIKEWGTFNKVYKTFFDGQFPARSAFGANGLALDARVEVECMAAFK